MKQVTSILIGLLLISGSPATAATLQLMPAAADVTPGSTITLDLVVADLGNTVAPSVGDFDVDISFDNSALAFQGYTLGSDLGALPANGLDISFGETATGSVNVGQVSFLSASQLDTSQPDQIVVASLQFVVSGLAPGNSTNVTIAGVLALGDADGNPLAVTATTGSVITATGSIDSDGDGVADSADNCIDDANADQRDTDGDSIGNLCDPDIAIPNDCLVNFADLDLTKDAFFANPAVPNWNPDADLDGDDAVNFADLAIMKELFFGPPGPSAAGCN